jgi:maltokinase
MGNPGRELTVDQQRHVAELLRRWIPGRRWFAGKGHTISAVHLTEVSTLPGEAAVAHLVVGLQLDGDHWQTYQVPLSLYAEPRDGLEAIGQLPGGEWVHDAVADPAAIPALLATVGARAQVDPGLTHGREPDQGSHPVPELEAVDDPAGYRDLPARPLSVEQSNSSVVLGDVALLKVFRQLAPGINPDVEVHAALGVARCPHVGRCLGWINGGWREPSDGQWVTGHLGMVQQLLAPATDGWALALDRVAAGEPFADDARALGRATGEVHLDLRKVLPTRVLGEPEIVALADRLHWRLDQAVSMVAEIGPLAPALHGRIDALVERGRPMDVQRIHGDYHLGQVLHTGDGWKLLDFEGEPGAAIATRIVPDHPLRDVAGMLRSFAYAAAQGGAGRDPAEVAAWQAACEQAFLAGYTSTGAADPESDSAILAAYVVDKAAYEAVYESRNRPDWLPIPMAALQELAR